MVVATHEARESVRIIRQRIADGRFNPQASFETPHWVGGLSDLARAALEFGERSQILDVSPPNRDEEHSGSGARYVRSGSGIPKGIVRVYIPNPLRIGLRASPTHSEVWGRQGELGLLGVVIESALRVNDDKPRAGIGVVLPGGQSSQPSLPKPDLSVPYYDTTGYVQARGLSAAIKPNDDPRESFDPDTDWWSDLALLAAGGRSSRIVPDDPRKFFTETGSLDVNKQLFPGAEDYIGQRLGQLAGYFNSAKIR